MGCSSSRPSRSAARAALSALLTDGAPDIPTGAAVAAIRKQVFGELLNPCLLAARLAIPAPSGLSHPERIVRRAEERFAEAEWRPVSLAGLCAASGASQSALYMAFQHLYGEPPLRYFHRRRLNRAREILTAALPIKGIVQQTAPAVGLTEFGRFSRDYRELFGETPSAMLTRSRK